MQQQSENAGTIYNIPVQLAFYPRHPYSPPLCLVKPTPDMMIKESKHVDKNGRIYMPYLSQWNHPSHSTEELLQVPMLLPLKHPKIR